MTIAQRIEEVRKQLPTDVQLVVVSKFHSPEEIMEAYNAGIRDFGENHVQELLPKMEALPKDIRWHFVGSLQRNKIKLIVPFVSLIHSIGTLRLYEEVVNRAKSVNRCIDLLIEIHIGQEESKSGFSPEESLDFLREIASRDEDTPYRRIRGLMGMASLTDNKAQIRQEFALLKQLFDEAQVKHFTNTSHFDTLSMGMSSDWQEAVEEGSNLIRVGTYIMGERNYTPH